MVLNIARLVLGALVLLAIALGVLRPMIRNLTTATMVAAPAPAAELAAPGGGAMTGEAQPAQPAGSPATLAYEQQVVQARNLVAQDPKRVAQVVKNWVGE
jgi:flagellar M-ring protein FliF